MERPVLSGPRGRVPQPAVLYTVAVSVVLHTAGVSEGFTALWERGRLDLTVEAHVLSPDFSALFTDEEREIARNRLREYGYEA